uniref:Uncharacterized protein n=1 Tax=Rhipicephalus zambeziensis TaxID=60191 RepID=A0A224YGT0_9ACAR
MYVRNLGNQDDSDRRIRPAILPVWTHCFLSAVPPFFFLSTRYRTKQKDTMSPCGRQKKQLLVGSITCSFRKAASLVLSERCLVASPCPRLLFDGWVVRIFFFFLAAWPLIGVLARASTFTEYRRRGALTAAPRFDGELKQSTNKSNCENNVLHCCCCVKSSVSI